MTHKRLRKPSAIILFEYGCRLVIKIETVCSDATLWEPG